jgi:hypothetical protein
MSTFAELKTELNIRLNDTDNFTFTSEEKTSILTESVNDKDVVSDTWDDSLTYDNQTFQYTIPATLTTVRNVYIKPAESSDIFPEPVASNTWEVVDGKVHITPAGRRVFPQGATLRLRGNYKYTADDTIAETNVEEFVLNLAQLKCLRQLGVKKAMKFLKNDTSVAEIVAVKRELEREVAQYRARLPRAFEAA